jgi:hypothetical protein
MGVLVVLGKQLRDAYDDGGGFVWLRCWTLRGYGDKNHFVLLAFIA